MEDASTAYAVLLERIGIDNLPDDIDKKLRQARGQKTLKEFAAGEFKRQCKLGMHAGITVNSGGQDGFSVGGGYSAVLDWSTVAIGRLRELISAVDESTAEKALRGPPMPHVEPTSGATALRVTLSRFNGGGGGGATAFQMSEGRDRHRLQEAIGSGDHAYDKHILGTDPGRYDPSDACRARAPSSFFPAEGPGDAYRRVEKEKLRRAALLDTSPRGPSPRVKQDVAGFGFREQRFAWLHAKPSLGPGTYDIPTSFDPPKPALSRSMNVPLMRGPHGVHWMPVRGVEKQPASIMPKAAARTASSPRDARKKVTMLQVTTANEELKK